MSAIAVARVENKIQSLLLGPLFLGFLVGIVVSAYHAAWWLAGVHVLVCFYIGWIGKNLGIHRGKSFAELSKGVIPVLPTPTPDESDDLSPQETRQLVNSMQHVLYGVIIATAALLLVAGTKYYWALLIGVVLLFVGLPAIGVLVGLMSISKRVPQHEGNNDTR
jgi:hypothetical protein